MQDYIKARSRVLQKEIGVRRIVALLKKATILFYNGFAVFVAINYGFMANLAGELILIALGALACVRPVWLSLGDALISMSCRKQWKIVKDKEESLSPEEKEAMLDVTKYTVKMNPRNPIAEISGFQGRKYNYRVTEGKPALYTAGMRPHEIKADDSFDIDLLEDRKTYKFDSKATLIYSGLTIYKKDNSLEIKTDKICIEHKLYLHGIDTGLAFIIDFTGENLTKFGLIYLGGVEVSTLFVSSQDIREQVTR